jgi:outer membrane cobalamin receptor
MKFSRLFVILLSLLPIFLTKTASAEIKIKVADPQGAAIAGAQVDIFTPGTAASLGTRITNAEGVATFNAAVTASYRIRVLAPGFAQLIQELPVSYGEFTLKLQLAPAAETVTVTATRTPTAGEASGSDSDSLSASQLQLMQPTAANDAIRFLPGAIINTAGQRGGLGSLFVRGGDSTYNKVIVDGVTVNEPGGTLDFGTLPLAQADRVEFSRGAQSTLYGTDAMTSVVQVWTRNGSTHVPELRFGADGGNFSTAHGYASLSGADGRFDYNLFGDQFNTNGQGINNAYSDSLEGANLGIAITDEVSLRVRLRHSNSHTGVPGEWNFNGTELQPPDPNEWSQLNSLIGSAEVDVHTRTGWQHRFTGFDYLYRYNEEGLGDADRIFDDPSHEVDRINRVGFEYQGDYSEASWTHSTFGYRVENENGFIGDVLFPPQTHGQRLNNDLYGQQQINFGRVIIMGGGRYFHSSAFGNVGTPRVAVSYQLFRGGQILSGTRLHFSYSTGFKEPRLEETFASLPYTFPNPALKPERVYAYDTGVQQSLFNARFFLTATYFNNSFHDQINYVTVNEVTFQGQYVNVNRAFAQGAEISLQGKILRRLLLNSAYTYTSTQILDNPAPINALYNPGMPLLRRPKHAASTLLTYIGDRWGANLGGSFVGPRPDSDFLGFNIDHAAGYVRVDVGGWFAFTKRITAYANVENALDRHYQEVVGYPALTANFRAGMRFRIGGE